VPTPARPVPPADRSGPSDDDLITWWGLVIEGFTRASGALGRDLAGHFPHPESFFEVMLRLRRTPGERLPMTQLANEVSFSSGGFTKLADRMEAAALVARVGCPSDRRVTWIELTDRGRAEVDRAIAHHTAYMRRYLLDALGASRFEQLGELMRVVRDAAPPEPGPEPPAR